ncbi:DUF7511 domain-containing protein [Natrarchaeobaculum sulfurireducens]
MNRTNSDNVRSQRTFLTSTSVVVRYENRTDRCTITPKSCIAGDRSTTYSNTCTDVHTDRRSVWRAGAH